MLLALLLAAPAWALDCAAILDRLRAGAPIDEITREIRRAEKLDAGALECVRAAGLPAEVVGAVEWRGSNAPEKAPATATRADPDGPATEPASTEAASGPVEDAIRLVRTEKHADAARALYALRAAGDTSSRVTYYLARALEGLGLHHSAGRTFGEVAARGPADPYFPYTIAALARVLGQTGDRTQLYRVVDTLPRESFPAGSKNVLTYLLGVRLLEQGRDLEARAAFATISTKSEWYARARFLEGVIFRREGKLKSAVRAFSDVVRHGGSYATQEELDRAERDKDLALLNIARIYFQIEEFEQVRKYYVEIPEGSPYRARALLERGWGNFLLSNRSILDDLAALVEAAPKVWLPEEAELRAAWAFNYDIRDPEWGKDCEPLRAAFAERYGPVRAELEEVLSRYDDDTDRSRAAALYARYLGPKAAMTALPPELLAHLRQDAELAATLTHLADMREEAIRIGRQRALKGPFATELLGGLDADRAALEARAGLVLLDRLRSEAERLAVLQRRMDVIAFEVIAAREHYAPSHPETVRGLRTLLETEPDGPWKVDMQFRLANLLDTPAERIPLYEKLLAEHPDYERADEVTWELALDHIEAGEAARATEALRTLVARWPDSPHVETLRKASASGGP